MRKKKYDITFIPIPTELYKDSELDYLLVGIAVEAVALHPHVVDAGFHLLRLIHLGQFFVHVVSLLYGKLFVIGSRKQKRPELTLRANKMSVVPPEFGNIPALITPVTEGSRRGLLTFCRDAPGRLHRGSAGAYTGRSLSSPFPTGTASHLRSYTVTV